MLHVKINNNWCSGFREKVVFQPKISSGSGKEVDFDSFAIFQ